MTMKPLPGNPLPPLVHAWKVGRHTCTLVVNRSDEPAKRSSFCDWDPPRTSRRPLSPRMQAQWQGGLSTAIAKFNAALGNEAPH